MIREQLSLDHDHMGNSYSPLITQIVFHLLRNAMSDIKNLHDPTHRSHKHSSFLSCVSWLYQSPQAREQITSDILQLYESVILDIASVLILLLECERLFHRGSFIESNAFPSGNDPSSSSTASTDTILSILPTTTTLKLQQLYGKVKFDLDQLRVVYKSQLRLFKLSNKNQPVQPDSTLSRHILRLRAIVKNIDNLTAMVLLRITLIDAIELLEASTRTARGIPEATTISPTTSTSTISCKSSDVVCQLITCELNIVRLMASYLQNQPRFYDHAFYLVDHLDQLLMSRMHLLEAITIRKPNTSTDPIESISFTNMEEQSSTNMTAASERCPNITSSGVSLWLMKQMTRIVAMLPVESLTTMNTSTRM